LTIVVGDERKSFTFSSCATRSANSVNVIFGLLGQVVVDNVIDVVDIEATSRNISRHKD